MLCWSVSGRLGEVSGKNSGFWPCFDPEFDPEFDPLLLSIPTVTKSWLRCGRLR